MLKAAVLTSLVLSLVIVVPPERTVAAPAADCGAYAYCDTRDPALPSSAQRAATRPDVPTRPTGGPPSTSPASPAAAAVVCNRYCDARDPALSPADRLTQTLSAGTRQISLHFNDTDAMGWARITPTSQGDALWLDRSFDAGVSWNSGSRLGDTRSPAGVGDWRTMMFNVDDWAARGVGLLRACAQPAGSTTIVCTSWYRTTWNAWSRSTAAATALMERYNQDWGLFETTSWWNGANALTAIIDNARITGMGSYRYAIAHTYDLNLTSWDGNFINEFKDDVGWWGLAWVAAYDLTGESRYLATARIDADDMAQTWDSVCGGGIYWTSAKTYKNAITNALYIQLNAALHNRIPGDTVYLQRARTAWTWFLNSGMINSSNIVNDGIDSATCANNGRNGWSYNQGVPLAALVELHRATGDASFLDKARALANASTTNTALNPGGILVDNGGGPDVPSFKGGYVRGLGLLNRTLADRPYTAYLRRQADSAYTRDRSSSDSYDQPWAGPFQFSDGARQHSALDLMNAAE
ncbi:glycoside hydrolase family 76 protein [Umezawaea endophytica]|uniref:Glycoside hydrolase family 76 protein n=1 Tax=Umezawaea endophytica TaxID=1654476 RepID=A0A9X2VMU1_9PSEU|nr:glycoside hydrolase family 76 protein [Umezawaea endophytica]MCS7479485.1 glycoside hydrolase family 76 protein [Umezawaea endophytica]